MKSKNKSFNEKSNLGKKATEWVANQEPPPMKPSVKKFTKIDGSTKPYSIIGIKANARTRVEQDVDLVLKNIKLKIPGQPYEDVILTMDRRFRQYKAIEDRIISKDGLRLWNNYVETGNINCYQILIVADTQ